MMRKVLYAFLIVTVISGGAWLIGPAAERPAVKKTDPAKIERLVERANEAVESGDMPAARDALAELVKIAPGSAAAKKLAGQVKSAQAAVQVENTQTPAGQTTGDDTTTTNVDNRAPANKSKLDEPGATPLSILPTAMDGYKVSNAWLSEPTMAGGTYQPETAPVARKVDRVFSTVVRSKTAKKAAESLAAERNKFPNNKARVRVGGIRAYTGTYGGVTTVAWIKGKWFFSIQVLPGREPSVAFQKTVAIEIAKKFGV